MSGQPSVRSPSAVLDAPDYPILAFGLAAATVALAWALLPAAAALALSAVLVGTAVRRPARWLAVLTWLLPFHILVIAALYGGIGLSEVTARVIAAWKEGTVLLLVSAVAIRALRGEGTRTTPVALDWAVGALLVVALSYLLLANLLLDADLPLVGQLYGFRDAGFFTLLYFVGRATPEIASDDRALRRLFAIGALTSAIAVLERIFVTPDLLVLIGTAAYFTSFIGIQTFNDYGLPDNYWSLFGSHKVQRAGSVYLSSQGFAITFLLIVPAATAWLLSRRRSAPWFAWLGYVLVLTGLLLSVARMTIIACVVQVALLALLFRRYGSLLGMVAGSLAVLAAAAALIPGVATFVWETFTWQSASSASHIKDWTLGIDAFLQRPLGSGLGTADQSAQRVGLVPLTADNLYLKYAVEMGIAGILAHLAILIGAGAAGWRAFRGGLSESQRNVGAVVLATTVGIAINALTAVLYNDMVLSYLYFWLVGVAATVALQQRGASPVETAA